MLKRITTNLKGKAICGIDIGGTDIKIALSDGDDICCFKEYDWNPKSFTVAKQLISPVIYLTKLVRVYYSLKHCKNLDDKIKTELNKELLLAMDKHADIQLIKKTVDKLENILEDEIILLDAVGLSFPDVVVRDKIVGGETTKTIGIKRNEEVNFEKQFAQITNLNIVLLELCKKNGVIKIIND